MTIAKRLFILLAVPLAVFLGLAWFTRSQLTKVEERADFVARSRIAALTTIGNLSRSYTEMRVDVRDCILLTNDARRQEARQRFAEDEAEVKRLLNHYADHLVVSNQGRRLLADYRALSDEWIARAKEVVELADAGQRDAAAKYMVENTSPIGNKLTEVSREWIKNNEELATEAGDAALGAIESYRRDTTIAIVAAALLTALLGAVTADRIVRPIRALDSSVRGIAGGDYAKVVPFIEAPDETGGLARSIDVLKQGAAAMEDQRWVKSHVSSLTAEVQGAETVAEFGQHFLAKLVPLLGGGVAGFYLLDEKGERLRRTATYGLTASATPADTIRLGEGLAGQCAQDRQMTMLTDLPPDYLRVSSSLGGGTPRVAVALPLLTKDTLLGVLEIAAFRELNPREKTLLTEILPLAAMSLEVLQRNLRTEELLTQTKSQAKQMEETEKFFRSVLELAPDGLMVVGADGVIRLANAQCEKLFGYARSELVGQAVEMLVPDTVRGHHSGLRESFHRAPSVRAMGTGRELQARRKDGSLFPVEIGLSPLPARGTEGMQVAVSIRDVTEQKKQQAEIMAAKQKAVEATEMKSMFLANMSHEIRTPMNAIIGLSHLALKTPLNPKQRDYVSKVHNAGTSLLAIINDILDFSKIEAGKLDIETTDFNLDDVLTSVTTLTAQKAQDKGLEFLVHVAPGIPGVLLGDPLRLSQILTNLINNAVKFTERGEIRVTAELLERTGEKCQLKLSVRDTGVGVTKEQAAKLFQPFTQADMSTTRKHGGTGLGLTISRRLVELMGGQIWLESEVGVGTTFTFTAWVGIGAPKGAGKIVPEKLTRLRVLVVDDNAAAREIVENLLKDIVHQTDSVASGPEAIAAVRQADRGEHYDVVFMDWRMPGMDGLQACRAIKDDDAIKHQPSIVMLTAFGREEIRDEAERLGLDGFLVKPVTKSMVVDALVNIYANSGDQAAAVSEATGEGVSLAGMRLLLVEDNEINRQIAVELLEGVGAQVAIATNGREAVDKIFDGPVPPPFDAILMDLQMPEMDGYQATARIRSDSRLAGLPIVAMTAHATIEERQNCLAAGMNDHIAKPIDPGVLFATLAHFHKPPSAAERSAPPPASPAPAVPGSADGELPAIDGLDTADGLSRVAGNRKLYLKLLRQFRDGQNTAVAQTKAALESGDTATAERLAHTLKGVAGNLGAKPVQAAAAKLEKLIHDRAASSQIETAVTAAAAELEPLLARLRAALPDATTAAGGPTIVSIDPTATRAIAEQLAKMLNDFDAGAVDFAEANEASLRPAFEADAWEKFMQHTQGFAFTDAQALLEAAMRKNGA